VLVGVTVLVGVFLQRHTQIWFHFWWTNRCLCFGATLPSTMNQQVTAVVVIVCCIGIVCGYPRGAPTSRCVTMTPEVPPHGTGQPTSISPYVITVNASAGYTPGETYSVTISKNNTGDPNFKGFLCQIRQVGQTVAIGTFSVRDTSKSKTIDCSRSKVS
jgi:hypothetical protein